MALNGYKWLDGWKQLEMTENGWKWLEMAQMAFNDWNWRVRGGYGG